MQIKIKLPNNTTEYCKVDFCNESGCAEVSLKNCEYNDDVDSDYVAECIEYSINEDVFYGEWPESNFSFEEVK